MISKSNSRLSGRSKYALLGKGRLRRRRRTKAAGVGSLKCYIQKYKVASFYISVLIISGVLLAIQSDLLWAAEYSISLPQLAPTLSVLLICFLTNDNKPLIQIDKHISLMKKDVIWIPIILGFTILAVALTAGILVCLGSPYIKWNGTALNAIMMLCGCFFEEIGWRGFVLPQLERRHNPLISTLIVGFLWGFWHMSFNLGLFGFLIFIVTAIEMSLLMTWIYHKTNGDLILMTLWHFSINVLNQILLTGRLTALGFGVFAIVLAAFCSIALYNNKNIFLVKRV